MRIRSRKHFVASAATTSGLLAGLFAAPSAFVGAGQSVANLIYVANQESATISVIDMASDEVVYTVSLEELGFDLNAKPHHTAVEKDGSFWYVSLIAAGKVLKFTRDNRLVGQSDFETPGMLAMHPTEDLLFVGRSMAAVNPPQRIGVISRSDMAIDEIDVFFPRPHAIAVHPTGSHVYTASLATNQIASLSVTTNELELTDLEGPPNVLVQFAVAPDGNTMVGTAQLTNRLMVFDISNPARATLLRTIDVNRSPWHPTFTPDGRFVYVGNQDANTVTAIETDGWTIAGVIEGRGLAEPHGIAVSPSGESIYVSNRNLKGTYTPRNPSNANDRVGTVVVIDSATRTIQKVIEVDRYPAGLGTRAGSS